MLALLKPFLPLGLKALAVLAVLLGIYQAGYGAARRACEADALRSQIAAMERDIDIARAAAANEERLRVEGAAREQLLAERLQTYVETTDAADACTLTDADVERLRRLTE